MSKIRIILFLLVVAVMSPPCFSQKRKTNLANGHEYVDLGLPSGTYWATCNVGAYSPSDFGVYFAWGKTLPEYLNKSKPEDLNGETEISGKPEFDAATATWHGPWRTPTRQEWEELIRYCNWQYVSQQSHEGLYAIGPSGRAVFFPGLARDVLGSHGTSIRDITSDINMTNGMVTRKGIDPAEYMLKYWSSSLDSVSDDMAYCFIGAVDKSEAVKGMTKVVRYMALPVRPVVDGSVVTDDNFVSEELTDEQRHPFIKNFESRPTGKRSGHEYVDLGLPSGTMWASCNIGATTPAESGNFYAWGEDQVKRNYFLEDDSKVYGMMYEDYSGSQEFDAASRLWGDRWRVPSEYEMQELIDKCNWTWSRVDGRYGYIVTGRSGNSIFIPASGYRSGRKTSGVGSDGYLWTSSTWNYYMFPAASPSKNRSSCLSFSSEGTGPLEIREMERENGLAVRPVFTPEDREPAFTDGEATFNSEPEGAFISVDNKHFGTTPFTVRGLQQGLHSVIMYLPRYLPYHYDFEYRHGQKSVSIQKLESADTLDNPEKNVLTVNYLPEGSEVYLDGRLKGHTPCSIKDISSGNHWLDISKDGYFPTSMFVYLYNKEVVVNDTLRPLIPPGLENVTGYVDLGLPSGTLWAARNIGAHEMVDLGNSIQLDQLKYFADDLNRLARNHEADRSCLPTMEQWDELCEYGRFLHVLIGEYEGYVVTGPNDCSIFIPSSPRYLTSDVEKKQIVHYQYSERIITCMYGVTEIRRKSDDITEWIYWSWNLSGKKEVEKEKNPTYYLRSVLNVVK